MLFLSKHKMIALSILTATGLVAALPSAAAPGPAELQRILAAQHQPADLQGDAAHGDSTAHGTGAAPQGGNAQQRDLATTPPTASGTGFSPAAVGAPSDADRADLDALHDQAAILKAQLEVAKLRSEIQKTMNTASAHGGVPPVSNPPLTPPPAGPAPMPQVLAVMGAGSRVTATILLPNGGEMMVSPGVRFPGGWTLERIDDGTVWARQKNGKQAQILPLAGGGSPQSGSLPYGASFPSFPSASIPSMPGMPGNPAMGGAAFGNPTIYGGIR